MSILLRLALTYAAVESIYGHAHRYLAFILVFSTIVDLDHIPQLLKGRNQTLQDEPVSQSRSRFHELYGLILFSLAFSICSLFRDIVLIEIAALSTLLHYATDFLLCKTRPLYPFSKQEVFLRADLTTQDCEELFEHHYKSRLVRRVRGVVDYVFLRLPLPKVNPNMLSGLSILTSLLFILTLKYSSVLALILIIITIVLDWFDGLIAKKHNLCSEEGHIVDLISDRLSEGIMFIPFFVPWFYLFLLNSILTVFSFVRGKHTVLPLRHAFLIAFVFEFL